MAAADRVMASPFGAAGTTQTNSCEYFLSAILYETVDVHADFCTVSRLVAANGVTTS
jgi:hypothetical protein